MSAKRVAGGVLTLCGVGVLCTLGTWQVQRLEWKNDIIARLETARASPSIFSHASLARLDDEETPLAYGSVKGTLLTAKDVLVGPVTNDNGIIGYHLVTPLAMPDGTVLVHRGWVSEEARHDDSARAYTSPAPVTFTGVLRRPDYNRFASGNNPAGDQWMRLDVAQIAAARELNNTAALVMYAESDDPSRGVSRLNPPGWAPRNNHKQYAVFWYGMAVVLAGFYAVLIWRNKKAA